MVPPGCYELAFSAICIGFVGVGYLTGKDYGGEVFATKYKRVMVLYPTMLLSFLAVFVAICVFDSGPRSVYSAANEVPLTNAVYSVVTALILVSPILAIALGVAGYKSCGKDLRESDGECRECGSEIGE